MDTLTRTADAVHAGYHALGNAARPLAGGTLVTDTAHPYVADANLLVHPVPHRAAAVDATVHALRHVLASPHRPHVHMGGGVWDALEARLAADSWDLTVTLELVLHGALRGDALAADVRLACTDEDWAAVAHLFRADHVAEALRDERLPYPETLTDAIVDVKRAKAPHLRVWLARDDGVDCGVFTSWQGLGGVGVVEDLFVLPEHRGHGIARALIHRAVADARARGAGPVLIGALPDDTPKSIYRRMGFTPLLLRRCWTAPVG